MTRRGMERREESGRVRKKGKRGRVGRGRQLEEGEVKGTRSFTLIDTRT